MIDHVSPAARRANMQAIKSANTAPEMVVRKLVHGMGFRYRLHVKKLPGKPDLVFGPLRKIIFVHGCFWHQHDGCKDGRRPKTNLAYWEPKFSKNITRDVRVKAELARLGWNVLAIWACEIKDAAVLTDRIREFLEADTSESAQHCFRYSPLSGRRAK